jgi:hypothetical protein
MTAQNRLIKSSPEPISFDATPPVQTVEEGADQFTLVCVVTGNPAPEISWNVRGHLIRGGNGKYAVTPEGLVIHNVTKADQVCKICSCICNIPKGRGNIPNCH